MPEFPFVQVRVMLAPDTLLGPGKADLLQSIRETGSIAAASRQMGMSYKRAWYLIDTMNAYFREPLVATAKGGRRGGSAQLTATGLAVVECYRRLQAKAARAAARDLAALAALSACGSVDAA